MRWRWTLALLVLGGAALTASACPWSREDRRPLLVLGDSIAAGNGASDPAQTSFAALLAKDRGVELRNIAVAGATTRDVIDKQLPQTADTMGGGQPSVIAVSVGGNDLAGLIPNPACVQSPLPATCPLDQTLAGVDERLDAIIRTLRQRYPNSRIVLLAYPNFFSGTGHAFEAPAGRVLPQLDAVIEDVASRYKKVLVARTAAAFEGKGGTLTHVLDPQFDPHPNDAGHRVIADAFEATLR
ncbi:MAG: hypothetical protein HYX50_03160 [Chloroflexi bacterium]|nr:hypothetical protein [Chloroflexota bacterium]